MKRRLKFRCWNCKRDFSLLLEIDEDPDILTECPYCGKEVLAELNPYRNKDIEVYRDGSETKHEHAAGDAFPEILPTREPKKGDSAPD